MSQKRPQYRYSWKKPWLYDDPYNMRRNITEREAYRKLKIIERHSSFKKPYWNFRGHQYGELNYSPHNPSRPPPYGGGGIPRFPPEDVTGIYPCGMACLGGILDCKNGNMCDSITCICGQPPYTVEIVSDPTGSVTGVGGINPQSCIGDPPSGFAGNYSVFALVTDNVGQIYTVEHPLVDCETCCESFSLSGPDTVAQGGVWQGDLTPRCPDATVVATSNSGCTFGSEYVSANGQYVYVPIGDSDCGGVTVTVTSPDTANCTEYTATKKFRITGGLGAWTLTDDYSSTFGECALDTANCTAGPCGGTAVAYPYITDADPLVQAGWDTDNGCGIAGVTQWGIRRWCYGCTFTGCTSGIGANAPNPPATCVFDDAGGHDGEQCVSCVDQDVTDAGTCDPLDTGYDEHCYCTNWYYNLCEWSCVCP